MSGMTGRTVKVESVVTGTHPVREGIADDRCELWFVVGALLPAAPAASRR
jgi:hypothetical protein